MYLTKTLPYKDNAPHKESRYAPYTFSRSVPYKSKDCVPTKTYKDSGLVLTTNMCLTQSLDLYLAKTCTLLNSRYVPYTDYVPYNGSVHYHESGPNKDSRYVPYSLGDSEPYESYVPYKDHAPLALHDGSGWYSYYYRNTYISYTYIFLFHYDNASMNSKLLTTGVLGAIFASL